MSRSRTIHSGTQPSGTLAAGEARSGSKCDIGQFYTVAEALACSFTLSYYPLTSKVAIVF